MAQRIEKSGKEAMTEVCYLATIHYPKIESCLVCPYSLVCEISKQYQELRKLDLFLENTEKEREKGI